MSRVTQSGLASGAIQLHAGSSRIDDCVARAAPSAGQVTHASAAQAQLGWLVKTIELDIIPRLLLAHRSGAIADHPGSTIAAPTILDPVTEIVRIVLLDSTGAASGCINRLRSSGYSLESVYLDVLAPAARRLGEMWENDVSDFAQVTIGLWRLQQLIYEFSPAFQDDAAQGLMMNRAMLVPAPGSQHTLGLLMVAEFFRRAGWVVWGDPAASLGELTLAARQQWFDVVGFSVATLEQVAQLPTAITAIRKASRNKTICVMVGGPAFIADPSLVAKVGADATARDAAEAVTLAAEVITARPAQS